MLLIPQVPLIKGCIRGFDISFFSGFWERAWSDMPVLKEVSSVVDPEKVWLCSKMEHDYSTIICFGRWGSMLHGTIFRQQLSLLLGIAATPAECHR